VDAGRDLARRRHSRVGRADAARQTGEAKSAEEKLAAMKHGKDSSR
jgi:hypothetical protein